MEGKVLTPEEVAHLRTVIEVWDSTEPANSLELCDSHELLRNNLINAQQNYLTTLADLCARLYAAEQLIRRFRGWDDLPGRADGPFWMQEADKFLKDIQG